MKDLYMRPVPPKARHGTIFDPVGRLATSQTWSVVRHRLTPMAGH